MEAAGDALRAGAPPRTAASPGVMMVVEMLAAAWGMGRSGRIRRSANSSAAAQSSDGSPSAAKPRPAGAGEGSDSSGMSLIVVAGRGIPASLPAVAEALGAPANPLFSDSGRPADGAGIVSPRLPILWKASSRVMARPRAG